MNRNPNRVRGDGRLRGRPERLHGAVGNAQQGAKNAEIDQQIGEHGPGERCGGREDAAAAHHEHDGQKHSRQRRNAEHGAAEQGEGVHVVAVSVGFPQVEFGELPAREFGNKGDGGTGVDHHLEDIGLAVGEAGRPEAGAGGQDLDALVAEIGPEDAGARQAEERRDEQTFELNVGIVAQRKQCPVGVGTAFGGEHFDAADDPVFASSGGQLDLAALAGQHINGAGQVDGVDVLRRGDDVEGVRPERSSQHIRQAHRDPYDVAH